MSQIRLANGVTLPLDFVTQTTAVIAKRRVGKSYTARRAAEQALRAKQQVVIVDPKGDHWGIRSAADGKSPGLPVVIIGGERADVPLEPGSGELVARLVVEDRVSALLDLSLLRKHEVATFMTAFLETVYRLKAREQFRTPLLLVIDEADAIAPQKPQPNEARMLGAAEDVVRRGGQRGIGVMLVTQRSAVLNKNVLTQAELLIALRTIAPQDLAALDEWVKVHGTEEQRDKVRAALPSLPDGVAFFWSPGWPTSEGLFTTAKVLRIETFDSGATPKAGERRVEPRSVADVDLDAFKKKMADTIERAREDDPKRLRAVIRDLQARVDLEKKAGSKQRGASDEQLKRAYVRGAKDERARWREWVPRIIAAADKLHKLALGLTTTAADLNGLTQAADGWLKETPAPGDDVVEQARRGETVSISARDVRADPTLPDRVQSAQREAHFGRRELAPQRTLGRKEIDVGQRILNVMAEIEALGQRQPPRTQVAAFCDYHPRTPTFQAALHALIERGLVEIPTAGALALTDKGRANAEAIDPIRNAQELRDRWLAAVGETPRAILQALFNDDGGPMQRQAIADRLQYHPRTPTFQRALRQLHELGAIVYPSAGLVELTGIVTGDGR